MSQSVRSRRSRQSVPPGSHVDSSCRSGQLVFKHISENEHWLLESILNQEKERIDVTQLKESRMYTALSFASFKNHYHCFKIIYKHALNYNLAGGEAIAGQECTTDAQKAQFKQKQAKAIRDWVNMPTDERFTALHFSTYHGNSELIKIMVEEMQADFLVKNVYGANVLHIAA